MKASDNTKINEKIKGDDDMEKVTLNVEGMSCDIV